jgi:hypothetical protein
MLMNVTGEWGGNWESSLNEKTGAGLYGKKMKE